MDFDPNQTMIKNGCKQNIRYNESGPIMIIATKFNSSLFPEENPCWQLH